MSLICLVRRWFWCFCFASLPCRDSISSILFFDIFYFITNINRNITLETSKSLEESKDSLFIFSIYSTNLLFLALRSAICDWSCLFFSIIWLVSTLNLLFKSYYRLSIFLLNCLFSNCNYSFLFYYSSKLDSSIKIED